MYTKKKKIPMSERGQLPPWHLPPSAPVWYHEPMGVDYVRIC